MAGTTEDIIEININGKVKVKVTKRGWEFYREEHKALTGQHPAYTPPRITKGGANGLFTI